MGLFDFFNTDNDKRKDSKKNKRESWDYGLVSERHFGKDKYGYYNDEESMYSDDERYDKGDGW